MKRPLLGNKQLRNYVNRVIIIVITLLCNSPYPANELHRVKYFFIMEDTMITLELAQLIVSASNGELSLNQALRMTPVSIGRMNIFAFQKDDVTYLAWIRDSEPYVIVKKQAW